MPHALLPPFVLDLIARFAIDTSAMTLLIFGMYYRRYRDKELVTAAALFNVFVFSVLTVLSSVQFGFGAGFGLFAILALFTLRSEPITKIEITYFFGSMAIAVICSVHGTTISFVAAITGLVLLGAYIIDHPLILRSVDNLKVTLDKIDVQLVADQPLMRTDLARRLGVEVLSYQILFLDYVNDIATIRVYYRRHKGH